MQYAKEKKDAKDMTKPLSKNKASLYLGYSENYLHIIRKTPKARYITMYGKKDHIKGHNLYMSKYEETLNEVIDFYYNQFENMYQFSIWLKDNEFYSSRESAYLSMTGCLFSIETKNKTWKFFKKMRRILRKAKQCNSN